MMLKNGATPDVVDFAQATLSEITSVVLPAITDASAADQRLVDNTFAMFEDALAVLEEGTAQIKVAHDEERRYSAAHKSCRGLEEVACGNKIRCDYDLYDLWRRFEDEESTLRQLSQEVTDHFCVEGANGTIQIFRDGAVVLFPPWIEQKPVVERWEHEYGLKVPTCERLFTVLDDKTDECDALQTNLENAACAHGRIVYSVRTAFVSSWEYAVSTYQRVVDEVHCLELDRWKEWRTLATVECLLNRTTERNGRPCDETTDEVVTEVTHCEEIQSTESVDHLLIIYRTIPEFPPYCPTPPWDMVIAVHPFPGRCVPVPPHVPCLGGFAAQEYDDLWMPPQPLFHSENSHCNPRQECVECSVPHCPDIHLSPPFVYPMPEHECHAFTQAHVDSWSAGTPGDSLANEQLPAPLSDLQRSRDRTSLPYIQNMLSMVRQDYSTSFCSGSAGSNDGCLTSDGFPGATTHNELSFSQVTQQLASVPEMEVSGQVRRLGDLGYFIFNDIMWEDDWKTFPIGADLEDHRKARPIADAVLGSDSTAWSTGMIREKAQEFFQGRNSFTQADLSKWINKLLHKIMLDMDITDAEEAEFEQYKSQSFILSLLPKTLLSLIQTVVPEVAAQIAALKQMRENLLDKYQEALDTDTRGIIQRFSNARDKKFVADLFLTGLTSAGGLSVPSLMGIGFAVLHGAEAYGSVVLPDFELRNNNIEQFVLECARRFPAVVGFPMWDPTLTSRHVLNLPLALRDPLVWEAPREFRLRPLSEYHETAGTGTKIGVAWAQQAKGNHGITPDSRGCPGQDLSVVIMSEMFRAYMSSQHEWSVAGVDGAVQITEGPSGTSDYTVVRNGASPEAAPAGPDAASPLASLDMEALQGVVLSLMAQLPPDWSEQVPAGIAEILANMPLEMAVSPEALSPEALEHLAALR